MKKLIIGFLWIVSVASSTWGQLQTGDPAPEFEGTDVMGNNVKLSDYSGKYVVLEWLNYECPFVKKHYSTGNMQQLQVELTKHGVVWISIISSDEGKSGYLEPGVTLVECERFRSKSTHVIVDSDGVIARKYRARCTPQMFVIAPDGLLIYQGAIDSDSSLRVSEVSRAENYVRNAWKSHMKGESVYPDTTQPYGCAIK